MTWQLTRMHSSRMHTARSSSRPRGVSTRHPPEQVSPWPGTPRAGTPQTRHPPRADPPACGQNSWHTLLKILPCPKLRLRAVKIPRLNSVFFSTDSTDVNHIALTPTERTSSWLNPRCESEREPEVNSLSTHDPLTLPSFFSLLSYFAVEETG